MITKEQFLEAARVPLSLQPQEFGLWRIDRIENTPTLQALHKATNTPDIGWPHMTILYRATAATLHTNGEAVMEDSRRELSRHLPIWLAAKGHVLVSGLGLGCVVRGLLANPEVRHIDVVEIDPGIMGIVGSEFIANPRVSLYLGDALKFQWEDGKTWDYAWHDIWAEKGLHVLHGRLIARYSDFCARQGAWMLPKRIKAMIRRDPPITDLLG